MTDARASGATPDPAFTIAQLQAAHKKSSRHRDAIVASVLCGCFSCCKVFPPDELPADRWTDDSHGDAKGENAWCPHCGIDAVIGDADVAEIVRPDFLDAMHAHYFGTDHEDGGEQEDEAGPDADTVDAIDLLEELVENPIDPHRR